jgi:two-component system sensor histidine kinase SenX3
VNVAPGRRGATAFFVTFGVCLVALAAALNVGWVVLTWRQVVPLLLGVIVFAAIITGLILNTTYLVREIRRNEQHDAFVNAVTHELKTPVTSIRLHLDTLRARSASLDEQKRQEFYGVMLEDTDRLLHTIEQVLRTGQTGRGPLHRTRFDLRDLVAEQVALAVTQRHLPDTAVRLESSAGTEPVEVFGDRVEIASAVMNLIDNAIKFSGDQVDVSVTLARQARRFVVRVTDRGPGLPPDELKRVFKRFYRVPGALTQRVRGTGLGLYIVYTAARRHGGRAWATSNGAGRGTTFHLELPQAREGVV